jgi:hypothetical protein
MAGESKTTTDHDTIRKWVEERGGKPATVKRTGDEEEPGVLRIDFPGYSSKDSIEEISWDQFFEKFEKRISPSSIRKKPETARRAGSSNSSAGRRPRTKKLPTKRSNRETRRRTEREKPCN